VQLLTRVRPQVAKHQKTSLVRNSQSAPPPEVRGLMVKLFLK
jgi:hypothetical protein